MIKHIVMWKLKEFAEGADKATNMRKVKTVLESCRGLVPGMGLYEVALADPAGPARGLEATYDVVLYSEFSDLAALKNYIDHPDHLAVKAVITPLRDARQCMDYEV